MSSNRGLPKEQMGEFASSNTAVFLIKSGSVCNLVCDYCFDDCSPSGKRLSGDILSSLMGQIPALPQQRIVFSWHGGEPLTAGLGYFGRVLEMEESARRPDQEVFNCVHTNGLLVDADWAGFFAHNRFSVSVSLDGPAAFHDRMRRTLAGRGSHRQAVRALRLLREAGLGANISAVVRNDSWTIVRELWDLCRALDVDTIKFWPLLRHKHRNDGSSDSVSPENYLRFLKGLHAVWLETKRQDSRPTVLLFEDMEHAGKGGQSNLCWFNMEACLSNLAVDSGGGVYPCDSFAGHDAYTIGQIRSIDLASRMRTADRRSYEREAASVPEECSSCSWVGICGGGCPYQRQLAGGLGYKTEYCVANRFLLTQFLPRRDCVPGPGLPPQSPKKRTS